MKDKICCDAMRYHSSNHCPVHSSPFECPDWLILHDEATGNYGIIIHDGGQSYIKIDYCPWCGHKLVSEKGLFRKWITSGGKKWFILHQYFGWFRAVRLWFFVLTGCTRFVRSSFLCLLRLNYSIGLNLCFQFLFSCFLQYGPSAQ